MKIIEIRTIAGPNIYSYKPVLVMKLDLEDLAGKESREFPGFNDRLVERLPGLRTHHCGQGYEGGFMERLQDGTWFGHIVEHVALELTELAGAPVFHGKTRAVSEPALFNVVVEYKAEQGTRHLLRVAVNLVEALLKGEGFPLEEEIEQARRLIARTELGPSTRAIAEAAQRRGIPWARINGGGLLQLGYGKNAKFIQAAMSSNTSAVAADIASDKDLTKLLLRRASIPVPYGEVANTVEDAIRVFHTLNIPVVVKPYDGRQGKGVSLNLCTAEQIEEAFHIAQRYSTDVLVEELFVGRDFRILVIGGRMVAASERIPAHVIGDGEHTVAELIEIENRNPLRGEGHDKPLTRLEVDEIMLAYLEKSGLPLEHVPAFGERVLLRESANLSTGGTAKDVTDIVHPEIRKMCERAARAIGLDICGIDLITQDITQPIVRGKGGIIEVNAAPGLRMHCHPGEGPPRDVGGAVIDMLYPPPAQARIPIISITGTNGKTTVTRMVGHALGAAGQVVGLTTTDGIWIGGEMIYKGDTTGPRSATTVLSDPTVEVAVLETARGGIVRGGLAYDWSDIAILTNVQADHIGQDGIKSVDDLLFIKSLVAERVREGGTLVLNADDERLAALPQSPRLQNVSRQIVFYSLDPDHAHIQQHLAEGGTAFSVRDGWVVEMNSQGEQRLIEVAAIPVTLQGRAAFQVSNVLAVTAACRAFGLSHEQIATALQSFRSEEHNAGRANFYQVNDRYVMVDYGHNPDAFAAVCRVAANWRSGRVTGVIGVPGDRDDSVIEQAGRTAARGFQRLIIREDDDLRGREPGEVAALLCRAIKSETPERECRVVFDEPQALDTALREATPGELVVVFYDKLDKITEVLKAYGAVPVSSTQRQFQQAA